MTQTPRIRRFGMVIGDNAAQTPYGSTQQKVIGQSSPPEVLRGNIPAVDLFAQISGSYNRVQQRAAIHRRAGATARARQELIRAQRLLEGRVADEWVLPDDGLTVGRLRDAVLQALGDAEIGS